MVLDVMMEHLDHPGVQMAATACLYNLTREDIGQKIHVECLKLMVCNLLECMTKHPSNEQVLFVTSKILHSIVWQALHVQPSSNI